AGALARGLLSAMSLRANDIVLVTAAAGRIGALLVQSAKAAGAAGIGAGGRGKPAPRPAVGAGPRGGRGARRGGGGGRAAPGGGGATLVLDAVGGQTAVSAFAAAADGEGRMGLYGYASGAWPPVDVEAIARRGLTLSGPLGMVFRTSDAEQRADAQQSLA